MFLDARMSLKGYNSEVLQPRNASHNFQATIIAGNGWRRGFQAPDRRQI